MSVGSVGQCRMGPIGPGCGQDFASHHRDDSSNSVPDGPANVASSSTLDLLFDLSCTPSPSSVQNFGHDTSSLFYVSDDILPDLKTLPDWRNTRSERPQVRVRPTASRPFSACDGACSAPGAAAACPPPASSWAGREGSGWQSALRVGVATLSAVLIVDHGEERLDEP